MKKLKFQLWWILKSPWTKKYGLWSVLKLWFKAKTAARLKSPNISICLCCFERTEMLKSVFIPALQAIRSFKKCEIVIACSNADKEEVLQLLSGIVNSKVVGTDKDFNRSVYLNLALQNASYQSIFITDVDIKLPSNFIGLFRAIVNIRVAWYPICDMLDEQGLDSHTYPEGVGLVGFINDGQIVLDESINTWGNEDWQFLYALYDDNKYPLRTINNGFLHHYHKPADKKKYKKSW